MIVVTGGAGFIGSHLVQRLVESGESVRVLERPGANANHLPLDRIELVPCDIRDRNAVRNAVQGCETVYHLAADPNLWSRDPNEFDRVNHQGTVHVLEESLAAGARRVLHTSTESILTAKTREQTVESMVLRAEDMVGPYCLSKFRAEEAAMRLARQGAPVVIVNPTLPVGPGDRGISPPTRLTLSCCQGKLPAYLDCELNMIDVRDIAAGMVRAMEVGETGRRYLLGLRNLRIGDWLAMAAARSGKRPPRVRVPYWLAIAIAHANEAWANHITRRMPMATVTGVRLTRYCFHFDPSQSLADLGLSPRPIEESLVDAIAFYRSMGWL